MAVVRSFKQKISEEDYSDIVFFGTRAEHIVVAGANRGNGQQEFDRLDYITNALTTDQVIYVPMFTETVPYTATIDVPGLKTTDAISVFIGIVPADDGSSAEDLAARMKARKKCLAAVDDVECSEDGKLVFKSYSKRPPSDFYCWLRGAVVPGNPAITFQLDRTTGDLSVDIPDTLENPPSFEYDNETGDLYMNTND